MEFLKQKVYTKHIKHEEILLVPVPSDSKGNKYLPLIPFEIIASKNISIPEMNKLAFESLMTKHPNYGSNPSSYNLDYYIVPGKSNIVVIDFDDIDITLKKIDYLCSINEKFQLNWMKFKNEYLEQTFKVQTPSGGFHYYFRHNLDLVKRHVKAIKPEIILSKEELVEYAKHFPNKEPADGKKKIKVSYDSVAVDVLANAIVAGAGTIYSNLLKKGVLYKRREYKILKDIELKVLDDSIFQVMKNIFYIKSDTDEAKEWKEALGKTKTKMAKVKAAGIVFYDYANIIAEEKQIELLNLKTLDSVLRKYSEELVKIKHIHRDLVLERDKLINFTLDEESVEFIEAETRLSISIKNELSNFKKVKKELIKTLFCKNPDTEYIFNSLRRYEIEEEYSKREQLIYPNLFDNIGLVETGKRSELEMAFVVNLKVRNYEDPVIYYLLQRDFSGDLKSFENPNFLEQATLKAETFKKYPEQLNFKNIWNEVILGYSLARKINYEKVFKRSGAKIRTLIETLYDNCSIRNTFTISNKSQTHFSLGGIGTISHKTIPKYLEELQRKKFFKEIVWQKNVKGRNIYPKKIVLKNVHELMELSWIKKNLLVEARFTPQDANQSFTSIKGVGARGLEILGYIRENGAYLHRKELYQKFENIKDHRRVIRKSLRTLEKLGILTMGDDNIYRLNPNSLNETYIAYATDYNNNLLEKDGNLKPGAKRKVRKKKLDLIESRKDNCINEKNYMKNLLSDTTKRKPKKKSA